MGLDSVGYCYPALATPDRCLTPATEGLPVNAAVQHVLQCTLDIPVCPVVQLCKCNLVGGVACDMECLSIKLCSRSAPCALSVVGLNMLDPPQMADKQQCRCIALECGFLCKCFNMPWCTADSNVAVVLLWLAPCVLPSSLLLQVAVLTPR